jgi:hypothetical protein
MEAHHALEDRLMIRPPARSRFAASRIVLKLPFRLTETWLPNSASSLSRTVASFMMPALLTRTHAAECRLGGVEHARHGCRITHVSAA